MLHEPTAVGLEFTTVTQREALEKLTPYVWAGDVGCADLFQQTQYDLWAARKAAKKLRVKKLCAA